MRLRTTASAVLAALALTAAAGCGSDEEEPASSAAGTATETTETTPEETTPEETTSTETESEISTDLEERPKIPARTGGPPAELKVNDIVEGDGQAAKAGDTVQVRYVGGFYESGEEFDASWDRGKETFDFPLGAQMVIPGWDQGLEGMKVGGRRELIIPADLAYGPEGQGPIPPNATLVFVVDLVGVA
jgi:FKBP-type peptidyl-prolyl cis-trans isomerase